MAGGFSMYRMTPEEAQSYRNATADFHGELQDATRWLPEDIARDWRRAEMSQFRDEWLKNNFRNNRKK